MKLELSVKGMTCGGCEMHVEKAVLTIEGVIQAKANHATGRLLVQTDDAYDKENQEELINLLRVKVADAGYELPGLFSKTKSEFSLKQWVGILIILAALFLVVRETGIMNALPVIESSMGYGLLFIIGLMTSVHCIGMCGGINLTVSLSSVRKGQSDPSPLRRALPGLLYNAGRVVSYTLIGGLVGALGSVISITGAIQGIIVGIAGLFMIIMGFGMLGIFPGLSRFMPRLPQGLTSKIMGAGVGRGPFVVGFLNGFMPCGPLQSVQIYALGTGSALSGALSMFLFSLGTVPLMLGFGSLSTLMPRHTHGRILKVSALLVLLLGGGMVLRGMSLNGISLAAAGSFNGSSENVRIAEIVEGKQYVKTIMHEDEYEPFIVQAGIPVVWTIYADEAELNGCNNPLTVPEYGIRFQMEPGENVIEFTPPSKPGNITYTCWMGMITSGIKVVEDLSLVDASLIGDTAALSEASSGSCSSGGEGEDGCSSGGEGEDGCSSGGEGTE
uniref:urease accessory protein UreH domain-containing protein n=1 Tax=Oceanispirochaeta sp. TaxID=2035350 RepID=UPI002628D825